MTCKTIIKTFFYYISLRKIKILEKSKRLYNSFNYKKYIDACINVKYVFVLAGMKWSVLVPSWPLRGRMATRSSGAPLFLRPK